jgi:hypothetical protein
VGKLPAVTYAHALAAQASDSGSPLRKRVTSLLSASLLKGAQGEATPAAPSDMRLEGGQEGAGDAHFRSEGGHVRFAQEDGTPATGLAAGRGGVGVWGGGWGVDWGSSGTVRRRSGMPGTMLKDVRDDTSKNASSMMFVNVCVIVLLSNGILAGVSNGLDGQFSDCFHEFQRCSIPLSPHSNLVQR